VLAILDSEFGDGLRLGLFRTVKLRHVPGNPNLLTTKRGLPCALAIIETVASANARAGRVLAILFLPSATSLRSLRKNLVLDPSFSPSVNCRTPAPY
jgi:hypothetical protein